LLTAQEFNELENPAPKMVLLPTGVFCHVGIIVILSFSLFRTCTN